MCGISGFLTRRKIDKTLLIKLSKTLIHRGPIFKVNIIMIISDGS